MKPAVLVTGLLAVGALGTAAFAVTGGQSEKIQVANEVQSSESDQAPVAAADIRALEWQDLAPGLSSEAQNAAAELNLRIDQMSDIEIEKAMATIESGGNDLVAELDDTDVSIEGYLVPLDFDAKEVSEFVLVPYFGACIHVPPPPANQVVYVKFREGLAMSEFESKMYYPFKVEGRIKAAHAKTNLADVGYQLTASGIEQGEIE